MILTGEAALIFKEKMLHPDEEAINKRDKVFAKIEKELTIKQTDTGFVVTVNEGGKHENNNY
ncbi:MAG: hypothetical protein NC489_11555 [Ruminococcus flavefaciens]|nr:hypothetical protein [Ruminococcus flavefaciens]